MYLIVVGGVGGEGGESGWFYHSGMKHYKAAYTVESACERNKLNTTGLLKGLTDEKRVRREILGWGN